MKSEHSNVKNWKEPKIKAGHVLMIPGIGISYRDGVRQICNSEAFRKNLSAAALKMDDIHDLESDDPGTNALWYQDSLLNQKIAYVVNCTYVDLLRKQGYRYPHIMGYSMGIYSALYGAGFYAFGTGLQIVESVYHLCHAYCERAQMNFGMGVVMGLNLEELKALVLKDQEEFVKISVYNGSRSFVISGYREPIDICLEVASNKGAFLSKSINTSIPFHNRFLEPIRLDLNNFLVSLGFTRPNCTILSLTDCEPITLDNVVDSIKNQVYQPIHFEKAVKKLNTVYGIQIGEETGGGNSMKKLVRCSTKQIRISNVILHN